MSTQPQSPSSRKGKVGARLMSATGPSSNCSTIHLNEWPELPMSNERPVFVLPADPASIEAMVEAGAKALNRRASGKEVSPFFMEQDRETARIVLAALNLTPRPAQPPKGRQKGAKDL